MLAQDSARLRFEVASIRPNVSGATAPPPPTAPNRFNRTTTVRGLIAFAYDIYPNRIEGGPPWAGSDQWVVSAVADRPRGLADQRLMVRTLLEERFALRLRIETRDLPVFDLVLARDDGRLGPRLTRAAIDCDEMANRPAEAPLAGATSTPVDRNECGRAMLLLGPGGGTLTFEGYPIRTLTRLLEPELRRPVIDKTGLAGTFNAALQYQPSQNANEQGLALPVLSTALEEDLGLKIESARGPVEILAIEAVERPTPD